MASPVFDEVRFYVSERAIIGSNVGVVEASDADLQAVTYSITAGNDAGDFAIGSSTGLITTVNALDYSVATSYALTVRATDGSNSVFMTVNITVAEYTSTTQGGLYSFIDVGGRTIAVRVNA